MHVRTDALSRKAHAWIGALVKLGVKPGDVVALEARPDARTVVHLMGLWAMGAVVVPIPLRYPKATWPQWAQEAGARWAVSSEPLGLSALPFATAQEAHSLTCPPPTHPGGVRLYTSGSTGKPKLLHLTWSALWHSASGVNTHLSLREAHTWLLALPLYHVGGLGIVVRTWMQGASLAFAQEQESLAETLSRTLPSHVSLVPTQLRRLLHAAPECLPREGALILGGSSADPSLMASAHAHGIPMCMSYGLSEMASTVTLTPVGTSVGLEKTSGVLLQGREMKEMQGELFVRGSTLFSGYVVQGEVQSCLTTDGWFPTGDLGHCDAGGQWRIVGRKDAMFISGGENIHPEAIEDALRTMPGIEDALVVPVHDAEFGHRPFAFLDATTIPSSDAVRAHLDGRIPRFMHPVGFAAMPPRVGIKPSRAQLQALAQAFR